MGEFHELSPAITISSVEPLRAGAHGQGPGQHRGPQVEPGGLWNSFRRASGIPCLPRPGTASKEYECQPFLTLRVMERGPSNRRETGGETGGGGRERQKLTKRNHSSVCSHCSWKKTWIITHKVLLPPLRLSPRQFHLHLSPAANLV